MALKGNKKPIATYRGDGFWINEKSKAKRPAHSLWETPPPGIAEIVRGRHAVSIAVFCSQRQLRRAAG
jgi:hypothetical protein